MYGIDKSDFKCKSRPLVDERMVLDRKASVERKKHNNKEIKISKEQCHCHEHECGCNDHDCGCAHHHESKKDKIS